jgi:hypothetical protein
VGGALDAVCVLALESMVLELTLSDRNLRDLQLARFMGKPGETSPKARFWMLAGWLLPTRFK